MNKLFWDLTTGVRNLTRNPKYSLVVLLTMVLGVSITTTMYSVTRQVVLQPLPVPDAQELVLVTGRDGVTGSASPYEWVEFPLYQQWQDQALAGLDLAFFTFESSVITEGEIPTYATNLVVSPNFLSVLGVQPLLGRWFDENDVGKNSIVLTHDVWTQVFASDPQIVGRVISVQKEPHTVLGVMPKNFAKFIAATAGYFEPVDEFYRGGEIIGRAGPAAQRELYANSLSSTAQQTVPHVEVGFRSLHEEVTRKVAGDLWLTMAGVAALMLVAVLNVINLTFAYYTGRMHELAMRVSLGATRKRLLRQLLVENLILAGVVGLLSALVSLWFMQLVVAVAGGSLPRSEELAIDPVAWLFSFALAAMASLAAAWVPASRLIQPERLIDGVKQGGGRAAGSVGGMFMRKSLISVEVGFSLVLLVTVGLLARSYMNVLQQETGFDSRGLVTGHIWAPDDYGRDERTRYFQSVLREIEQIPGIGGAASTSSLPMGPVATRGSVFPQPYTYPGQQVLPTEAQTRAALRTVSDRYFQLMGVPLVEGRYFDEREQGSAKRVAIINEMVARSNWPGESALGKQLHLVRLGDDAIFEVIGVVGDVRHASLDAPVKPEMFLSLSQVSFGGATFVVQAGGVPSRDLLEQMSRVAARVDSAVPMIQLHRLSDLVRESISRRTSLLQMLFAFSIITVVLGAVGIYGLSNYLIGQRTSEVAVRMAVGAKPKVIRLMILRESLWPVLVGVGIGLAACVLLARLISSFLFGVEVWDALAYGAATAAILLVSALATLGPAVRAGRISPSFVLHQQ